MFKRAFAPVAIATTVAALAATTASANHLSYYAAALTPLNMSGVSGNVYLTYNGPLDDGLRSVLVQVRASGLEPGAHAGHVHGFTGDPDTRDVKESVLPVPPVFDPETVMTMPDPDGGPDIVVSDGDGFTELNEGAAFYGGILQTFTGLSAGLDGTVSYDREFSVDAGSQLDNDVFPYILRETVLHGITLPFGFDKDGDGMDIAGSVDPDILLETPVAHGFLPVATGKFFAVTAADVPPVAPVPLPAGIWLMGAALGSLGAARKLRRKA